MLGVYSYNLPVGVSLMAFSTVPMLRLAVSQHAVLQRMWTKPSKAEYEGYTNDYTCTMACRAQSPEQSQRCAMLCHNMLQSMTGLSKATREGGANARQS